jgi:voltage-gated potassium channel
MPIETPEQAQEKKHVSPVDWAMLALALFSVALLTYEMLAELEPAFRATIITIDVFVCGIFALEFAWRWRGQNWERYYPLRNWYEILGMIPVAHPALRAFRLIRVVRIFVILARVGAVADRALGDEFTYRLVNRFTGAIVDAIKRPVTVAVLAEVSAVLEKGHYTQNVARALEINRATLVDTVLDHVRRDPQTRRLTRVPFFEDIVRATANTSLRMILEILEDPRTDQLVADILRENLQQIREAVRQRDLAAHRGDPET